MKLRIKGDSVRLRLTRSEVRELVDKGQVADRVRFSPEHELEYGIRADEACAQVTVVFDGARITVAVPPAELQGWAHTERVGIATEVPNGEGGHLRVLLEKDFACLSDRPGEDDSDAFPNPNPSC